MYEKNHMSPSHTNLNLLEVKNSHYSRERQHDAQKNIDVYIEYVNKMYLI